MNNSGFKFFIMMMILSSILLLSAPVRAETSSVTITHSVSTNTTKGAAASSGATDFTKFTFDTSDYNTVTEFSLIWRSFASNMFLHQGNNTFFTCQAPNICSGVASYNKLGLVMDWSFANGAVITSSPIVLTYEKNIFDTSNIAVGVGQNPTDTGVDANTPICLFHSTGTGCTKSVDNAQTYEIQYWVTDAALNTTVGYNISYPLPGKYTGNITKSGSIATKIFMVESTGAIDYAETTFNTNSFNLPLLTQGSGIYINATTSSAFTLQLINSSGVPTQPGQVGTNQTTLTKPSSGANVGFDKSSYFVGDNVNVSWYLSDSTQNDFLNKKLRLTLNDIPVNTGSLDCGGCVSITQQNGYYIYQASSPGILKAEVIEGIVSYTPIGSATVTINPPGGSWIAITNTTMNTRTLNNVTYHIGYSVANYPAAAIEMDINDISNGNLIDVLFPTVFPDGTMVFGQVHPIPVGNFSIRLIDDVKNQVLDTKYFTAIPLPQGVPTLGIKNTTISTDKSTYFYGDYMQVTYQVDDTNFSNYNFTLMAHIVSLDAPQNGIVTKMIINPFEQQVGTFTSLVNLDKNMKCDKGLNCWFNTGNNSINIVLMNNSGVNSTLAFANFTVSSTTVDGYGLQTSTTTPTTGVQFTVTTTIPNGHNGTLVLANAGTVKSIFVDNRTVGSGITTFPETIQAVNTANVAYYTADLIGDDGILKVRIPLTVSQVASGIPGGWTKREDVISGTCSSYDGWVGLMFPQGINDTNRFAFALVWIVAILFLTTAVTKNIGIGISFAFLPYAFFLYLSLSTPCGTYMPTWTGVFVALIIGIKLRWF